MCGSLRFVPKAPAAFLWKDYCSYPTLSPRKAAALIGDTLRSAVANAENNCDVNRKLLTVKAALVSPGPIIKRFRPKARGSAGRIRKRTSHFEVILTDNQ